MLRTSPRRCICRAVRGSNSQIWRPGTLVGIARKGPPVAVPGLGSQVSSWLEPPWRKICRTRLPEPCTERASAGRRTRPVAAAAAMPPNSARRERRCSTEPQAGFVGERMAGLAGRMGTSG